MSAIINKNMTSSEARMAFFSACEGKTRAEVRALHDELDPIFNAIYDREAVEFKDCLCGGK